MVVKIEGRELRQAKEWRAWAGWTLNTVEDKDISRPGDAVNAGDCDGGVK